MSAAIARAQTTPGTVLERGLCQRDIPPQSGVRPDETFTTKPDFASVEDVVRNSPQPRRPNRNRPIERPVSEDATADVASHEAASRRMPRNSFLKKIASQAPPPKEWWDEPSPF